MAVEALGTIESNAFGQLITSSASANTKGDYVELIASSAFDAIGIFLIITAGSDTSTRLYDIATGAAASETDIISNAMTCGSSVGGTAGANIYTAYFPVNIASGSRVSIRLQGNEGSDSFRVKGWLFGEASNQLHDMTRATTYGASTADSGGVQVDPGASAGTKGAYSEITASTTNPIDWLMVYVSTQGNTAIGASRAFMLDIATGAESSETIIIPDISLFEDQNESLGPVAIGPFPVEIAQGTRLAARATTSNTDATDRLFDVVLIGFDGTTVAGGGGGGFSAWMG